MAGTTASHSRYGQYERSRRAPTQSPTARRTSIRTIFATVSASFAALSAELAAAWTSYAASHPVTDSLGQSHTLDAHAAYVQINSNRANAGLAVSDDVPTSDKVEWTPGNVTATVNPEEVSLQLGAQPVGMKFLIQAGPVRNQVRTYEGMMHQFGVATGAASTELNITAAYIAKYGVPVVGKVVFARITPISTQGVRGTALVLKAIVGS